MVRTDPDGNPSSAYGLQRITNFDPTKLSATAYNAVPDIFISPEDIVMQSPGEGKTQAGFEGSPVVPDLTSGSLMTDWRFSWMFTGYQFDYWEPTSFVGDLVIFENRAIGYDQPISTGLGTAQPVTGEIVVEAVFGLSMKTTASITGGGAGYGMAANRTVLLRWPDIVPDPEVKVGSWIADVTYEFNTATSTTRTTDPATYNAGNPNGGTSPDVPRYQRCYWYQVTKRTTPGPDPGFLSDNGVKFRSMTVWVSTPLRAQTLLKPSGEPFHVNTALIATSVVQVISRDVNSH